MRASKAASSEFLKPYRCSRHHARTTTSCSHSPPAGACCGDGSLRSSTRHHPKVEPAHMGNHESRNHCFGDHESIIHYCSRILQRDGKSKGGSQGLNQAIFLPSIRQSANPSNHQHVKPAIQESIKRPSMLFDGIQLAPRKLCLRANTCIKARNSAS